MEIAGRGIVFFGEVGSEFSNACFPGVCVLPGGRWMVSFRASPKKQDAFPIRTMLTSSDDEGATWSDPVEPFSPQPIDGAPGLYRCGLLTALGAARVAAVLYWVDDSNRSLPFFNEQTEGILPSRILVALSEDDGGTWSEPRLLDTSPYDMETPITGPLLLLPGGEWALQFETNNAYYDSSIWRHRSVLMFSKDEGKTWPEHVKVTDDPDARIFYWDQRPGVFSDGTILDVFWTFDRKEAVYLNIHARESKDNGRTWSELWDLGIPGQPAPPVMLADGRIVMPYVDRERTPIIKLRVSDDDGHSWPEDTELILDDSAAYPQQVGKSSMQDAWSEMAKFSVGLPQTALLPDGDVLVVHYAGPETDHTAIRWLRVHP